MRWLARYRIKERIKIHELKKDVASFYRDELPLCFRRHDELQEEVDREQRCINRMSELLNKYL